MVAQRSVNLSGLKARFRSRISPLCCMSAILVLIACTAHSARRSASSTGPGWISPAAQLLMSRKSAALEDLMKRGRSNVS